MAESRLHQLSARGQSVWIDYLSRDLLETGELKRMMKEDAVVGVTSNPTIFQKALSQGSAYDEQLKELEHEGEAKEIFLHLAVHDVESALDLLAPVHEQDAQDGYVSIEVDPNLAYDTKATYDEAIRLHEWIDRPNLYVKIPGTKPGLQAIEDCIAAGRSINVTLLFSLEMHSESMEAYLRGLERFVEGGGDATKVRSVASFFVSRVDTAIDPLLPEGSPLRGRAAVANAKLAYQRFGEIVASDRWRKLAEEGATAQRTLWASTGTKNPEYSDILYVDDLIGPDCVNTMPEGTIAAFQDHGTVARTVDADVDAARAEIAALAGAGVSLDDVTHKLEVDGVKSFSDSFDSLIGTIRQSLDAQRAA
jgi:transaldolase